MRPGFTDIPRRRPAAPSNALVALLLATACSPGAPDEPRMAEGDGPDAPYMCPPCHEHEDLFFHEDGTCPVCGMAIIERPDSSRVGEARIHEGSGNFLVEAGPGHPDALVQVFYHRPSSFTSRSPILIVVPGAGRDADEYRDAWVDASERYGVLVLSPMYREDDFDFAAYHLGGVMYGLNLEEAILYEEGSNRAHLDETVFGYRVNPAPEEWIFDDFDDLFGRVAEAVGSERESYDLFGHSAGGQILHRLALFHPNVRADRILAGNSGFFTLPDTTTNLPFGVADAPVSTDDLVRSLAVPLVLFLGEADDASETGGTLLRSPTVDRQGLHRYARGRHFFETGRALAEDLGVPFAWSLEVVPGVGHDFRAMSEAAAEYLYGSEEP